MTNAQCPRSRRLRLIAHAAAVLLLGSGAIASQLAMVTVKQPLYLHGSDTDPQIEILDVPVANATAYPETFFEAIHLPFIPATNGSWTEPSDVNMTSVYGIKVSAEEEAGHEIPEWKITIDASAARQPEGYPFTVEQVVDATLTCVKLMCPPKPASDLKVTIKVIPPRQ